MSPLKWVINPEHPAQSAAIETFLDEMLGRERRFRGVYRLRPADAHDPTTSFTACTSQSLIASIRFWPVRHVRRASLLGPLAVRPAYQRSGVGSALVIAGLGAAARTGVAQVFVVGEPSYYGRFDFRPATANVGWIPEPVERTRILVLNVARPHRLRAALIQKVWVRGPVNKQFNGLRATNSNRSGQRLEPAQSRAA